MHVVLSDRFESPQSDVDVESPVLGANVQRFASIAKDLPEFRHVFCKSICSALGLPAHGNCVEASHEKHRETWVATF